MRPMLLASCLLLAACGKAPPPAEPATSAAVREASEHHELKEAIDSVDERDRAAHANDAVIEADKKREQELKDAGG